MKCKIDEMGQIHIQPDTELELNLIKKTESKMKHPSEWYRYLIIDRSPFPEKVDCTTCWFFNKLDNNCGKCDSINNNFTNYTKK